MEQEGSERDEMESAGRAPPSGGMLDIIQSRDTAVDSTECHTLLSSSCSLI